MIVDVVIDTLAHLQKDHIGILLVEQNAEIALEIADQASILEQGEIVYRGSAQSVMDNPELMSTYLGVG